MYKAGLIFLSIFVIGGAGCGSVPENSNANSANANAAVNVAPEDLPEGLSPKPIEPEGNIPGISNSNKLEKVPSNVSPAPGIPSADELKKPRKPGATPTPGIPSEDELRKQMSKPPVNANANTGGR